MNDETIPSARQRRAQAAVPVWALVFISALFVVSCLSLWAFIVFTRPTVPKATSSAVFIVVTPIASAVPPTFDPLLATLGVPTPTSAIELTSTVPPVVNPGFINLGSYVQVVRTEGDPLKMRQQPSLSGDINYFALPSEVFKVQDGPVVADGFTWWYLVSPTDETRTGWAVENYLDATNGP
jgi:hypothetical protein